MTLIHRDDDTFVIVEEQYHVVPKTVDPKNKYDYDEIKAYAQAHPDDVVEEATYYANDILLDERATLKSQCNALDLKAVRPLRAIAAGTGTEGDAARLAEIEAQVATIRARIAEIDKIIEFCDKNL